MSDLTAEERALLAAAAAPRKRKARLEPETATEAGVEEPKAAPSIEPEEPRDERVDTPSATQAPTAARGPYTPAQYDDDGWNGLPVQMRG